MVSSLFLNKPFKIDVAFYFQLNFAPIKHSINPKYVVLDSLLTIRKNKEKIIHPFNKNNELTNYISKKKKRGKLKLF